MAKINAPHKAYSKQTLKAYRQVAQRLAIALGYLEVEQQAWLKHLWKKILNLLFNCHFFINLSLA